VLLTGRLSRQISSRPRPWHAVIIDGVMAEPRNLGFVRHLAPVADATPVVLIWGGSLCLERCPGDDVSPLPAVLQPEQPKTDSGQACPQPPAASSVVERPLPQREHDECDTPQHRDHGDGSHPVDVDGLYLRRLTRAPLARTHSPEASWHHPMMPNRGMNWPVNRG
jgi:hypothetical protein